MIAEPWLLYIDESIRDDVITVGGFLVPARELETVMTTWRELKADLGLEESAELKYSLPSSHETRRHLDSAGLKQMIRVPRMLDTITTLPITVVANTLIDRRKKTAPVDLYVEALRWCIRRAANHLASTVMASPAPIRSSWTCHRGFATSEDARTSPSACRRC